MTIHVFKEKRRCKKKKPAEKEAWKSDSLNGAAFLIFLLFHKGIEDPDDFRLVELQQHPNSPFQK